MGGGVPVMAIAMTTSGEEVGGGRTITGSGGEVVKKSVYIKSGNIADFKSVPRNNVARDP